MSSNTKQQLVIFGTGEFAEVAHYYFKKDTNYEISAFVVDQEYIQTNRFCDRPVVAFEALRSTYPPDSYYIFIGVGYNNLNGLRMKKYMDAKSMGYRFASYISPRATILNDGAFGDNCFVLEDNTIQPFSRIGNNVTLWSGNHIGHHSVIEDHCFISSHVVISGGVRIGARCFVGVNATFRDHVSIGERCVIGAGALILGNTEPEGVYIGTAGERSRLPSSKLRRI
jgi:sugar O-acyltransferase (sialic acid O-acetyltransferase NeuD family)